MLIVEDEADIKYVLHANFKKDGYSVWTAGNAEAGLKLARKYDPSIILMDIMLPKMDGLEMLRELRQFSSAPVLFLTAKKDEVDRIVGLKLGAEDYITKPFSLEELRLRVKRILHHTRTSDGAPARPVRAGRIEIDVDRHLVRVNGRSVNLTPREFQLLRLLVEAEGRVVSRELLSQGIWGDALSQEIDIRMVDQITTRLRKKLAPERHMIVTVCGAGYQVKMDAPVPARRSRRKL